MSAVDPSPPPHGHSTLIKLNKVENILIACQLTKLRKKTSFTRLKQARLARLDWNKLNETETRFTRMEQLYETGTSLTRMEQA